MTANGFGAAFGSDKNAIKLTVMMASQKKKKLNSTIQMGELYSMWIISIKLL